MFIGMIERKYNRNAWAINKHLPGFGKGFSKNALAIFRIKPFLKREQLLLQVDHAEDIRL
jgi:hypothetical protein